MISFDFLQIKAYKKSKLFHFIQKKLVLKYFTGKQNKEDNSKNCTLKINYSEKTKTPQPKSTDWSSILEAVSLFCSNKKHASPILSIFNFPETPRIVSSSSLLSQDTPLVAPTISGRISDNLVIEILANDQSNETLPLQFCDLLKECSYEDNLLSPESIPEDHFEKDITLDPLIDKQLGQYRFKEILGIGGFSRVYLAENTLEGNRLSAIKVMSKRRMQMDRLFDANALRELNILKMLKHKSIVQLEATIETDMYFCLVLEYVPDGDLYNYVRQSRDREKSEADEQIIKKLVYELIEVISWLHDQNVVHRDLKLENILLWHDKDNNPHIKLTDFGLACVIDPKYPVLYTQCGSLEYVSPEIYTSRNGFDGQVADIWSLGIIIYGLLIGHLPFAFKPAEGDTLSEFMYRISNRNIKWPNNEYPSEDAKEVIQCILERRPELRVTLREIVRLSWFLSLRN
ncbi:kinase-like domain-containing protein [Cokeromyces recurvatus]|uniref:kinase-like domain-containing protein n=1 Tax=Cokeromyces recurvatus TaxID=90255 RepID=UPI00221E8998|nr:kinase-like domain-containing protein [Cokeromyces recurvatus]KAI7904513.1 kinase-like domain-containing protein [Cokeromyces recurvatus]